MRPRIFLVSACAQMPPNEPVLAPMTATGLPRKTAVSRGREPQSSAFLSAPGMEPLYSGVTMRTASAPATAERNASTASRPLPSSSSL